MRIAVSKGHNVFNNGVFDNGASGNGKREAPEVDKTVDHLIPMLRAQGHTVVDVTPKNEHFNHSKSAHGKRAQTVNRGNFDIYLDVHLNAGGGTGAEMWVYSPSGVAYDYARKLVNNMSENTGLRNRGVKVKPTMWSLVMTNCPSIVVEGGFIDSKADMDIITPKLYARSIASAFGKIVEPEAKPSIPIDREIYRVRKTWKEPNSQQGAYHVLDSAIVLAEKLNLNVYNSKGVQVYPKIEVFELITYTRLIKSGVRGDDVKLLQTYLNKLGFNAGTPDGIAGANTDKAIRLFQKTHNLTVDGLAGRSTINKINQLISGEVDSIKPKPSKKLVSYRYGAGRVIEIDPMDLSIEVNKSSGNSIKGDFINGSFYDMKGMKSISTLVSDGKILAEQLPHDNVKRGTLVVYKDGSVAVEMIDFISKFPKLKDIKFAIGGFNLLPSHGDIKKQFKSEWFDYGSVGRKTSRSMVGYSKKVNKIIIVIAENTDATEGQALMKKIGCDIAVGLDSGASTSGRFNDELIRGTSRVLHNIVRWN